MTREEIVLMARKAVNGRSANTLAETQSLIGLDEVERFATIVAEATIKAAPDYKMGYADGVAAEREACAKVCESAGPSSGPIYCAYAIRARS